MNLQESPGFLAYKLAHAIHVELDRRLKVHGVTLSQWKILMHLWRHEGRSQVELQEQLGLERATITGLLQRMTSQGWVLRRVDPHDRRVQRVFLTERGRALEPIANSLVEEVNMQALEGFSADEREFFIRLLVRALGNVERQ
jgi:DNA-binding MarR family transcriptional regulator